MVHPTLECSKWVEKQIPPPPRVLGGILNVLLPAASDRQRSLIGCSIMGQILFHKMFKPVVTLLVGPEESASYDADLLAKHITQFTLGGLGMEKALQEPAVG